MCRQPGQLLAALAGLMLCVNNAPGADVGGTATQPPGKMLRGAGIVSIVIDDLGNRRAEGLRAIELPGPVTYAVLPHTAYGSTLARLAHSLDKEVIVHVPMEAVSGQALGRGGLTANLSRQQFTQRARAAITSVPYAQGVSNHMGSRLTAMERPMQWLMEIVAARDHWIFLDSRTTADSVAELTARDRGLHTTFRDVFLDNEVRVAAIRARFREVIAKARTHGSAVAIGHPHAETLQVLAEELPRLVNGAIDDGSDASAGEIASGAANDHSTGIRLVPLSQLIATRSVRRWAHRQPGLSKTRRAAAAPRQAGASARSVVASLLHPRVFATSTP